ncbi:MAG: PEGA domain-containing protein [Deltaproteobacteria bacterium]|nr:MAG: PEGA domain-containing protein [Deltaproteobacteria bacterium]
MTPARAVAFGAALAVAAACSRPAARDPAARPADAILSVDCPVAEAEVYVDDAYVGRVAELGGGVALAPGVHRVEVRHDDYHTGYLEIEVRAGQRRRVAVDLAPRLP